MEKKIGSYVMQMNRLIPKAKYSKTMAIYYNGFTIILHDTGGVSITSETYKIPNEGNTDRDAYLTLDHRLEKR